MKAIDSTTKNRVAVRYFDATDPESYQTADISSAKLSDLNFDRDIIVFTNDLEQNYLKVDLPFLNDRKFRYVMPANAETGASSVNEGVLPFAFIKTDDFETQSITLVLADDPNIKYDISYGVSVEYQLGLLNAPSGKYNHETDSSGNLFMLTQADSYGPKHYVADNKYIVYSVDGTQIHYSVAEATEENYNAEIGAVYSYDEGRIVYDPLLGTFANAHATSLNTLLDPVIAENEYNRYIAEQTANGFTVDTMNFVYISRAALEAYCLNGQDESLLGIDVQEFYDMERTVGPNEYYTVDADGNLTKLNFPPKEDESKGSWLDRLLGAIISVGIMAVGVIIVATVGFISCGAATAAAPYIMGAFIGAGMEVFMQTVIQGKPINEINWLRVGVAAVSGVLSAIPGVGWFGAGMIQGVTEAAMTAVDGGSLEDVFKAFTVGFITGVVIHGVGKALKKIKFCFTAGTPVLMAAGYTKAIENIRPGDFVKSYNQITGKTESKRVLQTFENETDEITKITTSSGDTVNSTPGHKFYANGKWISAQDLRAGDILVTVNGEQVIVEQVQHEILENPIKIYNFEVADNNSYYVGREAGVLVHNFKCSNKFDNTEIIVNGFYSFCVALYRYYCLRGFLNLKKLTQKSGMAK